MRPQKILPRPPFRLSQRLRWVVAGSFSLALLSIAIAYGSAMRWQLVNRVIFEGPAQTLPNKDKGEIRHLILSRSELVHSEEPLLRYRVTLNRLQFANNSRQSAHWSGVMTPNRPVVSDAIIGLTKENDTWRLLYLATGS